MWNWVGNLASIARCLKAIAELKQLKTSFSVSTARTKFAKNIWVKHGNNVHTHKFMDKTDRPRMMNQTPKFAKLSSIGERHNVYKKHSDKFVASSNLLNWITSSCFWCPSLQNFFHKGHIHKFRRTMSWETLVIPFWMFDGHVYSRNGEMQWFHDIFQFSFVNSSNLHLRIFFLVRTSSSDAMLIYLARSCFLCPQRRRICQRRVYCECFQ